MTTEQSHLPCPFCGCLKPLLVRSESHCEVWIECPRCLASAGRVQSWLSSNAAAAAEKAWEEWDTRAPQGEPPCPNRGEDNRWIQDGPGTRDSPRNEQ